MIMQTYGRFDVKFVKGEGCVLIDEYGKKYIDFASGIGVNSVGYANAQWVDAVCNQAKTLAHVSNLYHTTPAEQLASKLAELSGLKSVFFSNSGAEANEGVIKCARKYSRDKYGDGRNVIATLEGSFHGRTITTLSATGQDAFHQNFFPFTEGFIHVPKDDIEAVKNLGSDVCAIMLEAVQGEGGVHPCSSEYLREVEKICAERDWLLIFDEVQTGIGRCGTWFAYQKYGVSPDLVSFAKGIAGGLPLGGFIANQKCSGVLGAGQHATTFGGNPICCAAALSTLNILESYIDQVEEKGNLIRQSISKMNLNVVKEIRGLGLMLGVAVSINPKEAVQALLNEGLVCLTAGKDAIRFLPPLVIQKEEIESGLQIFEKVIGGL